MDKNEVLVSKIFKFSAAHLLRNHKLTEAENRSLFGDCWALHGHNYRLEVTVSGSVNSKSGMVVNFDEIKNLVNRAVIKKLDHRDLNALAEFKDVIPTVENVIMFVRDALEKEHLNVKRLKLWETDSSYAELLL